MFKKIALVIGVIAIVAISYIVLTATMPTITEMSEYAANYTGIGEYTDAKEAVSSAPLWIYFIPGGVGGIFIVLILRS